MIVWYNGVFLPDILLLTQAPVLLLYGSRSMAFLSFIITTWLELIIMYFVLDYTILYCTVICFELFGGLAWRLM